MPVSAFAADLPEDGTQSTGDADFVLEQDEVSDTDLQSEEPIDEEIPEELVRE